MSDSRLQLAFDLDAPPLPPYQRHSETSRAAAESVTSTLNDKERRVLRWFADYGPGTDDDVERDTGIRGNTVRPRRVALLGRHLLRDTGEKRPTRTKRMACVWAITQDGRDALKGEE